MKIMIRKFDQILNAAVITYEKEIKEFIEEEYDEENKLAILREKVKHEHFSNMWNSSLFEKYINERMLKGKTIIDIKIAYSQGGMFGSDEGCLLVMYK